MKHYDRSLCFNRFKPSYKPPKIFGPWPVEQAFFKCQRFRQLEFFRQIEQLPLENKNG